MTRSLFSIVCFIGAVALFFLYTKPAYDGLVVHKKEIVQYDLALDKAAELQRLKQTLLSRFNSFDQNRRRSSVRPIPPGMTHLLWALGR